MHPCGTLTQAVAFGLPSCRGAPWSDLDRERVLCDRCATAIPNLALQCGECGWDLCVSCMREGRGVVNPGGPLGWKPHPPHHHQDPAQEAPTCATAAPAAAAAAALHTQGQAAVGAGSRGGARVSRGGKAGGRHRCLNPDCGAKSRALSMGRTLDDAYLASLARVAAEYGDAPPQDSADTISKWADALTGEALGEGGGAEPDARDPRNWVFVWGRWVPREDVRLAAARGPGRAHLAFRPWHQQVQEGKGGGKHKGHKGEQGRKGGEQERKGEQVRKQENKHEQGHKRKPGQEQGQGQGQGHKGKQGRKLKCPSQDRRHPPGQVEDHEGGEGRSDQGFDFHQGQPLEKPPPGPSTCAQGPSQPPDCSLGGFEDDDFLFTPHADSLKKGHPRYRINVQVREGGEGVRRLRLCGCVFWGDAFVCMCVYVYVGLCMSVAA